MKAAPEPAAMKATSKSAVKAAPESTAAKTAGLGSPSADRGGKRESNDRSRQQQLAGHETLLLTFLIRFHHRIAVMCADDRPKCLLKTDGWLDGIEYCFWRSGTERLGSDAANHDAPRFTGKLTLQASDWKLSHRLE
jgi:hypothetical protein